MVGTPNPNRYRLRGANEKHWFDKTVYRAPLYNRKKGLTSEGIMDILSGLSGLKTAADLAKTLRDGLKDGQIKGDQISGRIGEIYDYIVDSKAALVDAKDQVQELKAQLQACHDEKAFRDSLRYDHAGIYRREPSNGVEEAYCSACLDLDGKRVRLTGGIPTGTLSCQVHGYRKK